MKIVLVLLAALFIADSAFADYGYHYNRRGTGYWRDDSNDGYQQNNANYLGMNNCGRMSAHMCRQVNRLY